MSVLEILNLEDIGGSKEERGIQFRVLEYHYDSGPPRYMPQWNGDISVRNNWIDVSEYDFGTLQEALDEINEFRDTRPFLIKEVYKSY